MGRGSGGALLHSEAAHPGPNVYFSTVDLSFILPLQPQAVDEKNKKTQGRRVDSSSTLESSH